MGIDGCGLVGESALILCQVGCWHENCPRNSWLNYVVIRMTSGVVCGLMGA